MNTDPFGDDTPVYVISVAAQLSGLHPQTLRTYDRMGLVCPGRTAGRGRRYSMRDIVMLREIQRLSQEEGVNLSGIKHILELQRDNARLREELARAHAALEELANELESTRSVAARLAQQRRHGEPGGAPGGDLVPIRHTSVVVWHERDSD
ncbi:MULTISPECIES: heat shock protein transcriptional repressor HspR [Actinomadura]|uniref:MerR family transcriptional regulator, heat shock protein HspR n=1 Tax=Actinomadura madurae TaxID=1993 RepID=A0A1I5LVR8_9ACTN|nr:helix-turn-helix transcriptional regulator [Actinomadura madurae]SFP01360.1 MerR family transcriptional regulator, heat shock protein HspR [Actinomadura madurae]SPT52222.1 HTH-type transcriptional regulator glnR [Actinomadura madurae]